MDRTIEQVADGFAFPEGPCFDAKGDLYVTQCGNGWIARVRGGVGEEYVFTGKAPNGAVFSEDNVLWIAEAGTNQLLRYDGAELVEIASECDGRPLRKPNDLVFAPDGSIYMRARRLERTRWGRLPCAARWRQVAGGMRPTAGLTVTPVAGGRGLSAASWS